jgi:hypothetical protein
VGRVFIYTSHVGPGRLHSCTNYQTSKAIWSSLNDGNTAITKLRT